MKELTTSLLDWIFVLSEAVELTSSEISNHHRKVAVITNKLSQACGHSETDQTKLLISALIHDSGSVLSLSKDNSRRFNFHFEEDLDHANQGYRLLRTMDLFREEAEIIRYHHVRWNENTSEIHPYSHILHLADRISVLVKDTKSVLDNVPDIKNLIKSESGKMFSPELVDIFLKESEKEDFWFDTINSEYYIRSLRERNIADTILDFDQTFEMGEMFRRFIDFRSSFTAIHSKGVSTVAALIGSFRDFSTEDCRLLQLAGFVHDLGKLAIPLEILDKPSALDRHEFNIIKSHTYYTYKLLSGIKGLETINKWASFHHEKLDGKGYPFHKSSSELCEGSRIMTVADIFVALAEDRPYRKGMPLPGITEIMKDLGKTGKIDIEILDTLIKNMDEINQLRAIAQTVNREYLETVGMQNVE